MSDIFSKDQRSKVMKAVKSRQNITTEIRFLKILKKFRIKGWKRHYKILGRPDFAFVAEKTAIFIDGCFWHGHTCRNLTPRSNALFWKEKINKNKKRDRSVSKALSAKGWSVYRIWECKLKSERRTRSFLRKTGLLPME